MTTVDLNRYHIYLVQLKIAAIRSLPTHEDLFNFFGTGKHPQNREKYFWSIRSALEPEAQKFWDKRIGHFVNGGLYDYSRNANFLRFFQWLSRRLGCRPEKMLEAPCGEQAEYFDRYVDPFFDSWIIKAVGRMPVTLFGLGIPPQQYEELKRDLKDGGTVIDIYRERARRLSCDYPIDTNYFAWQALARKYDTEHRRAVPEYLKAENYEKLRANISHIEARVSPITFELSNSPKGTFNRFVFLDAQDWMDAAAIFDLWSTITVRAEPGSRIIFRTAGAASPIENIPESLRARFTYERERSLELFKQDRSSIYGGFHHYTFNG
jgi:S-adenosylmethionine-diacylglycerol 3-amino-3-carboxypropyl transferase